MAIEFVLSRQRIAALQATPSLWSPNFSTIRWLGSFASKYPDTDSLRPKARDS